jgi:hypothetical protein
MGKGLSALPGKSGKGGASLRRGRGVVTLLFILKGDFGGGERGVRDLALLELLMGDGSWGRKGLSRRVNICLRLCYALCGLTGCIGVDTWWRTHAT